ncbi:MAG: hypothetical protein ACK56W_15525 [Pirellula sp.]
MTRNMHRLDRLIQSVLLAVSLLAAVVPNALSQSPNPPVRAELEAKMAAMELLFCFQGKGSCLPYDGGVLHEAYARIPAMRQGHTIVAGNSSGSIPAAFFCCFGMNDETVRHAENVLKFGNRDAVRNMENINNKISKLSQGKSTEIPHTDLREYIAFALGVQQWRDAQTIEEIVRRSSAKPNHPCLIVACNKEVLEDRHPENKLSPGRLKEIDLSNMTVSWKPEVYEYYRNHTDRFRRDHPELILGPDRRIGRAVTFFVDPSMYDLLSRIPSNERIADLRLMTDAADVALAILASASEPTYFDPVVDPHPEKVLAGGHHNVLESVRHRIYNGGYIISLPAQDVRRMLPGIRVVGTGWRHNPLVARTLLKNMLLADCEEIAFLSEWWADLEVNPDAEFESHIEFRDLSGEEEFQFGVRRAKELFDRDSGLPAFVMVPHFHTPTTAAIAPLKLQEDMFTDGDANAPRMLKTLRGIAPITIPASQSR